MAKLLLVSLRSVEAGSEFPLDKDLNRHGRG